MSEDEVNERAAEMSAAEDLPSDDELAEKILNDAADEFIDRLTDAIKGEGGTATTIGNLTLVIPADDEAVEDKTDRPVIPAVVRASRDIAYQLVDYVRALADHMDLAVRNDDFIEVSDTIYEISHITDPGTDAGEAWYSALNATFSQIDREKSNQAARQMMVLMMASQIGISDGLTDGVRDIKDTFHHNLDFAVAQLRRIMREHGIEE